jgi:predicted NBD/HSP70 family sugar kinase
MIDLKPYTICLNVTQSSWRWSIIDDDGELILHGRESTVVEAASKALRELERFVKEATG